MHLVVANSYWMGINILLACVAVPLAYAMVRTRNRFMRAATGVVWLLFLPNTIYMLTDLYHLPRQWHASAMAVRPLLLVEYGLLVAIGLITFVFAVYPFERFLESRRARWLPIRVPVVLAVLNFVVAYGVAIGRVQRANSWDVLFNTGKVVGDGLAVLMSGEMVLFVLLFGLAANAIYFALRGVVANRLREFVRR